MRIGLVFTAICFMHMVQGVMQKDAKIYVAGHTGLVGSALIRQLARSGYTNIITQSSDELDLRSQKDVEVFFKKERPEYVFLAAARVGGIVANATYPASFIYDNLAIQLNVINAAYVYGVTKLLFLGSSCIYPRNCPQPIKEEYLLTSELEATNEPYAIAKIAGLKMCQAYNTQYGTRFIAAMPTNLYGPHDNFDLHNSHVIPALIRKCIEAKRVGAKEFEVWGTGKVYREFLHVDDLAAACLFLMNEYDGHEIVNVGTGQDIQICELADLIKDAVGYEGAVRFDSTKPDGTPRKLLEVSRMKELGWKPSFSLKEGLRQTVAWCEASAPFARKKVCNEKSN